MSLIQECAIEESITISITPIKTRRFPRACESIQPSSAANKARKMFQEEKKRKTEQLTNESDKFDSRFYLRRPRRNGHEDELNFNMRHLPCDGATREESPFILCNQLLCEA